MFDLFDVGDSLCNADFPPLSKSLPAVLLGDETWSELFNRSKQTVEEYLLFFSQPSSRYLCLRSVIYANNVQHRVK